METLENKPKRVGLLIAAVGLGVLLNPLNTTMISVALARLQEYFEVGFEEISWLIATYYLASAIANPIMGKLGDSYGRKKLFLIGLLLVTLSSFLAPFSTSFGMLLAFRIVQAVGTSAVFPSGMAIVRQAAGEKQARAFGYLAMFTSSAAALGPSVGGMLLDAGDWPALFMINFPIIAASFVLILKVVPPDAKMGPAKPKIDVWGMLWFSAAVCLILMFLLSLENTPAWWTLAGAVITFWLFYRVENRAAEPFIKLDVMIRNLGVLQVNIHYIFANLIYYSIVFGMPIYYQTVYGLTPSQSGLAMLALAIPNVMSGPMASRLVERIGVRATIILGSAVNFSGGILLALQGENAPLAAIILNLALFGLSAGMLNVSLQQALYMHVAKRDTGVASGLFMNARFFGSMMSSSLLGFVFHEAVSPDRLKRMAVCCAIFGVLMVLMALRQKARARQPEEDA